jgi:hypothetical protein
MPGWANDDQTRAPVAQPGQPGEASTSRYIDTPGLRSTFLVERKLAAQDPILSFNRPPGSECKHRRADKVGSQARTIMWLSCHHNP